MKYYKLYHNKEKYELKLELMKENDSLFCDAVRLINDKEDLIKFNNNYYLSNNRLKLKELGGKIKFSWFIELKNNINKVCQLPFETNKENK